MSEGEFVADGVYEPFKDINGQIGEPLQRVVSSDDVIVEHCAPIFMQTFPPMDPADAAVRLATFVKALRKELGT